MEGMQGVVPWKPRGDSVSKWLRLEVSEVGRSPGSHMKTE